MMNTNEFFERPFLLYRPVVSHKRTLMMFLEWDRGLRISHTTPTIKATIKTTTLVASGVLLHFTDTPFEIIGGMAMSPNLNEVFCRRRN